jgi:hypothetical protein
VVDESLRPSIPAYRDELVDETVRAVEGLKRAPDFAAHYTAFRQDMVYGKERPEFKLASITIGTLAGQLRAAPDPTD